MMKTKLMKIVLALGGGMLLLTASAHAVTINLTTSSPSYLGKVASGTPSGDANEVAYINFMNDMAANAIAISGGQTYTRSSNLFVGLVDTTVPVTKDETGSNAFTLDGTTEYILGKYGSGQNKASFVWVVAGMSGSFTIPQGLLGGTSNLSHVSKHGGGSFNVPDGGATLALLGLGLASIGALKKVGKKRS